jgi:hypothetical protein
MPKIEPSRPAPTKPPDVIKPRESKPGVVEPRKNVVDVLVKHVKPSADRPSTDLKVNMKPGVPAKTVTPRFATPIEKEDGQNTSSDKGSPRPGVPTKREFVPTRFSDIEGTSPDLSGRGFEANVGTRNADGFDPGGSGIVTCYTPPRDECDWYGRRHHRDGWRDRWDPCDDWGRWNSRHDRGWTWTFSFGFGWGSSHVVWRNWDCDPRYGGGYWWRSAPYGWCAPRVCWSDWSCPTVYRRTYVNYGWCGNVGTRIDFCDPVPRCDWVDMCDFVCEPSTVYVGIPAFEPTVYRSDALAGVMGWTDTPESIVQSMLMASVADRSAVASQFLGRVPAGGWDLGFEGERVVGGVHELLLRSLNPTSRGLRTLVIVRLSAAAPRLYPGQRVQVTGRLAEICVDDPFEQAGRLVLEDATIK